MRRVPRTKFCIDIASNRTQYLELMYLLTQDVEQELGFRARV
jgi:hypothetical protein